MKIKTLDELIDAHPILQNVDCGVSVSPGWIDLLDRLCRQIERRCEQGGVALRVTQVKEKFGCLRFYVDNPDEFILGAIAMAESMSLVICEECGGRGSFRGDLAWMQVLCTRHYKKVKDEHRGCVHA